MSTLQFAKYEGLGNDFIVVETEAAPVDAERAKALCDRHFGVGADGVLFVGPADAEHAGSMVVINADGSRPEMCGNGLRCVALHLARRLDPRGHGRHALRVRTDAGTRACAVELNGADAWVSSELGHARHVGELREADLTELAFTQVDIGNPHAIVFDVERDAAAIDALGPQLSARTPAGTNVEFALQRGPRAIDLVVWERGVGRTLACGTGAGATAFAAVRAGRSPRNEPITVVLPGGPLELTVDDADRVSMRGPARLVFEGQVRSR